MRSKELGLFIGFLFLIISIFGLITIVPSVYSVTLDDGNGGGGGAGGGGTGCTPNCAGAVCGDNGCGGSCSTAHSTTSSVNRCSTLLCPANS